MGTNFRGWLNFVVFVGTSQTAKNNPSEIFVRLRPHKSTHRRWARQAREWRSFITLVQPLTTQEKLRVLFSFAITRSLIHEYHRTTIIRKRCGNYTHNKSAKIKTYENLILKMFQQKREILTPQICTHTVTGFIACPTQNRLAHHIPSSEAALMSLLIGIHTTNQPSTLNVSL